MTYTFKCAEGHEPQFAYLIKSIFDNTWLPPKCSDCGETMGRIFDAAPTHFAGGGWGKDAR